MFPRVLRPPTAWTTEFFTKTQLRLSESDRMRAQKMPDLWRWYKGDGWAWEAESLLREGIQLAVRSSPPPAVPVSPEVEALTAILGMQGRIDATKRLVEVELPAWSYKVSAFLRRYQEENEVSLLLL